MSPEAGDVWMSVARDGHTDLPPGKLAALVTYLEMTAPARPRGRTGAGLSLERIHLPDVDWYLRLYTRVGEDWLWFSRRAMPRDDLRDILHAPGVEVYALRGPTGEIGLAELDRRIPGEVELAFFGLVPEAIGSGAGAFMMDEILRHAWAAVPAPGRVMVHTCSFDHPGAIGFYRRSGFVAYRRAIELADDPRLTGVLPRSAAPQVPIVGW